MDDYNLDSEAIIDGEFADVVGDFEGDGSETLGTVALTTVESPNYLTLQDLQVALSPISFLLLCLCFLNLTRGLYSRSKGDKK